MHCDMPGLNIRVNEVTDQTVTVAVEVNTDQFPSAVEHGRTGIAADGVGGGNEVEGCIRVEPLAVLEPTGRQGERFAASQAVVTREELADRGVPRDVLPFGLVTANRSESEAEGEGGIRRDGASIDSKPQGGEGGVGLPFRWDRCSGLIGSCCPGWRRWRLVPLRRACAVPEDRRGGCPRSVLPHDPPDFSPRGLFGRSHDPRRGFPQGTVRRFSTGLVPALGTKGRD